MHVCATLLVVTVSGRRFETDIAMTLETVVVTAVPDRRGRLWCGGRDNDTSFCRVAEMCVYGGVSFFP